MFVVLLLMFMVLTVCLAGVVVVIFHGMLQQIKLFVLPSILEPVCVYGDDSKKPDGMF